MRGMFIWRVKENNPIIVTPYPQNPLYGGSVDSVLALTSGSNRMKHIEINPSSV